MLGYVYFFMIVLISIGFCYAYKLYVDWAKYDEKNKRTYISNKPVEFLSEVPVVNNLDVFALHKFKPQPPASPGDKKVAQSPTLPRKSVLKNASP